MKVVLFLLLLISFGQCNDYELQKRTSKKFESMSLNQKKDFLNGFIRCKGDFKSDSDRYSDTLYHKLKMAFPIPRDIKITKNNFGFSSNNLVSISKIKDAEMGKLISKGQLIFKDYMEVNHKYKFYILYSYDGVLFKVDSLIVERYK